jgi:hypothetical protein
MPFPPDFVTGLCKVSVDFRACVFKGFLFTQLAATSLLTGTCSLRERRHIVLEVVALQNLEFLCTNIASAVLIDIMWIA